MFRPMTFSSSQRFQKRHTSYISFITQNGLKEDITSHTQVK